MNEAAPCLGSKGRVLSEPLNDWESRAYAKRRRDPETGIYRFYHKGRDAWLTAAEWPPYPPGSRSAEIVANRGNPRGRPRTKPG